MLENELETALRSVDVLDKVQGGLKDAKAKVRQRDNLVSILKQRGGRVTSGEVVRLANNVLSPTHDRELQTLRDAMEKAQIELRRRDNFITVLRQHSLKYAKENKELLAEATEKAREGREVQAKTLLEYCKGEVAAPETDSMFREQNEDCDIFEAADKVVDEGIEDNKVSFSSPEHCVGKDDSDMCNRWNDMMKSHGTWFLWFQAQQAQLNEAYEEGKNGIGGGLDEKVERIMEEMEDDRKRDKKKRQMKMSKVSRRGIDGWEEPGWRN